MKVAVIGGGPGGYIAAIKAAMMGAEVTLIDKSKVGGTCLNAGCIPTKALLASTEKLNVIKEAEEFGINIEGEVSINFEAIMKRKEKTIEQLVKGIEFLLEKRKIKVLNGFGRLIDKSKIEVLYNDNSSEVVEADKIILATGSVPIIPPLFPFDGEKIITSNEALVLKKAPESLIVVGGGVIGSEFGQFFNMLGTKVTIIEMAEHLLPPEDKDTAKQLERAFKKDKIKIMTKEKITKCEVIDNEVVATLEGDKTIKAEMMLISVGRKPYLENLGVEELGIKTEHGKIVVNEKMETNIEGIYAIGDIINSPFLAHVATKEGTIAAENAMGLNKKINYKAIPRCVYTDPEVASVGITEKEAEAKGIKYNTGQFDFRALGKAQVIGKYQGFIKIIVDAEDKIIGAAIVGPHATDLLAELTLAVHIGITAEEMGEVIHPHPTLTEGIMEALHDVHKSCLHSV